MTTDTLVRPLPTTAPWTALPILIAGAFMVVLDFFVANVAIPSISSDLHASASSVEWIVASYGLAVGTLLVTAGRLGDSLGRRRVYVAGVAVFTLGSLACGAAPSVGVLIGARILQGVGGGLLMPQVLAIIGTSFTGGDRGKAMGIYSMTLGLAAVGGQLVGGALLALDPGALGWRACFLVNVPIGLAALALVGRAVPEETPARRARLDLLGALLLADAVTAITLPLIEGRAHGWPAWTWATLASAPVFLALFVARQRRLAARGGAPLLDLTLFSDRVFRTGLAMQLLFWMGQAAFFLYLALYLQPGRGLDALQAGLVFTIVAVAYVAASGAAPQLAERHGRAVPLAGGLMLAAGHGALAVAVSDVGTGGSLLTIAPGLALVGTGMGLCLTSLNEIVLGLLDPRHAGAASGVLSTVQDLGNALGVAVTGVVFFGAASGGLGHAFAVSAEQLALVGAAVALLSRLLPARR